MYVCICIIYILYYIFVCLIIVIIIPLCYPNTLDPSISLFLSHVYLALSKVNYSTTHRFLLTMFLLSL